MAAVISYSMKPTFSRIGWIIASSGTLGGLLYAYLYFSETGLFPSVQDARGFGLSALVITVTGFALYYFNQLLDRLIPWRNYFATRFVVGYVTNFALALGLTMGVAFLILTFTSPDVFWPGFTTRDPDITWKVGILLLASLSIYTIVYALLYSYQQYAVAQIETLQRERKQLELQFEALKSQVSPHYLFNSLNTISSLIYKDPQSAEQFIRRLAQTYQYILATQNKRYVLLREEVEFVQSYYYLLRIRFQQQLTVEFNLPSSVLETRIPPLTLQILVENAVKHNTMSADNKLFIYITAQDNTHLRVINTKAGYAGNVQSFRIGLENIRKRYEFFTDRKIEIRDEDKFVVSLPILHAKPRPSYTEHKYSA